MLTSNSHYRRERKPHKEVESKNKGGEQKPPPLFNLSAHIPKIKRALGRLCIIYILCDLITIQFPPQAQPLCIYAHIVNIQAGLGMFAKSLARALSLLTFNNAEAKEVRLFNLH